jgi:hypothetical protein
MHGSNARNLSVKLFLSQASKNAMSFLLLLMFSLQQKLRTGRYREVQVLPGSCGEGWEGDPNNNTHVSKCEKQ